MRVPRKQYSKEFKLETVRLITEGGVSVAQASRDFGINDNVLHRWKKELSGHGPQAFPGNGQPIEAELARLRREVEILKRPSEQYIKKATILFAQHHPET